MDRCDVLIWGEKIGELYIVEGRLNFIYTHPPQFEISPLHLPTSSRVFDYTDMLGQKGLAGVFADTLPDYYGESALNTYFTAQNREPNTIDKLLFIGNKAMGAISYEPSTADAEAIEQVMDLNRLYIETKKVVNDEDYTDIALVLSILKSVSPLGGAKPKALIGFKDINSDIFVGARNAPLDKGYCNSIIKFNTDEKGSSRDELATEYSYMQLAKEIGINIPDIVLSKEGHYIIKRFDNDDGQKLHMHTLQGILHSDFAVPRTVDYTEAFRVLNLLNVSKNDRDEFYKRMVFNYLFRNHDDHEKNHSFLMDRTGNWHLSPAYDITFSYRQGGRFIGDHQLKFNGKVGDDVGFDDFREIAEHFGIKAYKEIIQEVLDIRMKLKDNLQANNVSQDYISTVISAVMERRIDVR